MPVHLRGPLLARMRALYDRTEEPPATYSNLPPDEEASCSRWCRAFRRVQDAQVTWLREHGYTDALGHVDWHRYNAERP